MLSDKTTSLFDRIAPSYDRLNHLLSLNIDKRWRRRAVKQLQPADSVLDVAIGTGDLTIEILRQRKARRITGIDLSEQMMAIGKQKIARQQSPNTDVEFLHASAQEMPFDDAQFDAVTCAYGVRNFSDIAKALGEMHRVLKPGGELMILEFGTPDSGLFATLFDFYFTHVLPTIGGWFSHDKAAYTYLNRSVKSFPYGQAFCESLRQAGFTDVTFRNLTFGTSVIYHAKKCLEIPLTINND